MTLLITANYRPCDSNKGEMLVFKEWVTPGIYILSGGNSMCCNGYQTCPSRLITTEYWIYPHWVLYTFGLVAHLSHG